MMLVTQSEAPAACRTDHTLIVDAISGVSDDDLKSSLRVPAADDMLLYQPHHATAFDLKA